MHDSCKVQAVDRLSVCRVSKLSRRYWVPVRRPPSFPPCHDVAISRGRGFPVAGRSRATACGRVQCNRQVAACSKLSLRPHLHASTSGGVVGVIVLGAAEVPLLA